jgi:fatty acid-binding protein DegV
MSKVAIVTDSIGCIPPDLVKKYEINIVPVGLVIDRKIYKDTELTNEKFWEMFHKAKEPITTNAVSPGDFVTIFNELSKKTDSIVCLFVYQSIRSSGFKLD